MQLTRITTGSVIGSATLANQVSGEDVPFDAKIHAGRVLRHGVRDINAAGRDLELAVHDGRGSTWGTVGFFRNGDAWDAVELLAPRTPGSADELIWAPFQIHELRLAPGVQLDAVWQVSDYGGPYPMPRVVAGRPAG